MCIFVSGNLGLWKDVHGFIASFPYLWGSTNIFQNYVAFYLFLFIYYRKQFCATCCLAAGRKMKTFFMDSLGRMLLLLFAKKLLPLQKKCVSTACDSWKKRPEKGTPQEDEALDKIEYSTNHFINMTLSTSTAFISTVSLVSQNLLYTAGSKSSSL